MVFGVHYASSATYNYSEKLTYFRVVEILESDIDYF